jgi:hypothetical protein
MRFYIASGLENAETVQRVASVLRAAGHTQTFDWTEYGHGGGEENLPYIAKNEARGVASADMLIVLLPGGRGTHVELGIALGAGVGQIFVCAESEEAFMQDGLSCPFYHHEGVRRVVGRMDDWLTAILSIARTGVFVSAG